MQHSRTPLKDRAEGRWREILPAFGLDSRHLDGKHHPCPKCGGRDRWRFDDLQGQGTSICGQCGARTGMQLAMDLMGWSFAEMAIEVEKIIGTEPPSPNRAPAEPAKAKTTSAEALKLWREASRIVDGDPVDLYLKRRLGSYDRERCAALRFHPGIARYDGGPTMPGMLSAFSDVHRDITGLQRTFLSADGQKDTAGVSRLFVGPQAEGGAVRLGPVGQALGIAEGVETALAASRMFGLVVWAGLTAGGVLKWLPPEGVEQIVIFADADENFTGQSAAFQLAHRLMAQKVPGTTNKPRYQVQVELPGWSPPEFGTDFNDILQRGAAA